MPREYTTRCNVGDIEMLTRPNAEDYLSRKVFEIDDVINTGILDASGRPIRVRERLDPIGFIRRD